MDAVVVGGGIGGLCAAIGLREAGWRVTVLEQAPEFTEIGAGITLWPNALRALDALGLSDRILPLMTTQSAGRVRDLRGRTLRSMDSARIERELGRPLLAIHRAQLLDLLRDALPSESLCPGVTVSGVTPEGTVRSNAGELTAHLVVGADGIHSAIRAELWPEHPGPRYVGCTAFRGVLDPPGPVDLSAILGPGMEIGMVPLTGDRLYWYVAFNEEQGTGHCDPRAFLLERLASAPRPVPEMIERTPADRVLHHDLLALRTPLPTYVRGRVALLGDAAHAMAPFLGQGGCQAIEDAVVLAASLAGEVETGLGTYDRARRPRSQSIARQSAWTGRGGVRLTSPIAVALRDAAFRLVPQSLGVRAVARPTLWQPPTIPRPGRPK